MVSDAPFAKARYDRGPHDDRTSIQRQQIVIEASVLRNVIIRFPTGLADIEDDQKDTCCPDDLPDCILTAFS